MTDKPKRCPLCNCPCPGHGGATVPGEDEHFIPLPTVLDHMREGVRIKVKVEPLP